MAGPALNEITIILQLESRGESSSPPSLYPALDFHVEPMIAPMFASQIIRNTNPQYRNDKPVQCPSPNLIPTFLDPFPPLITISLSGGAGEAGSRVCFCQRCNVKGIIKHHIVTFLDMLCYRLCGVLYAMKSSLQNIL